MGQRIRLASACCCEEALEDATDIFMSNAPAPLLETKTPVRRSRSKEADSGIGTYHAVSLPCNSVWPQFFSSGHYHPGPVGDTLQ